jgi:hypothetical protein
VFSLSASGYDTALTRYFSSTYVFLWKLETGNANSITNSTGRLARLQRFTHKLYCVRQTHVHNKHCKSTLHFQMSEVVLQTHNCDMKWANLFPSLSSMANAPLSIITTLTDRTQTLTLQDRLQQWKEISLYPAISKLITPWGKLTCLARSNFLVWAK